MGVKFKLKCCQNVEVLYFCTLVGLLVGAGAAGMAMAEGMGSSLEPALRISSADSAGISDTVPPPSFKETLLEIHLNGQNLHQTALLLSRPDGQLLVCIQDLENWRLRPPDAPVKTYQNEPYVPLDALGSVTYQVDAATQSLWIDTEAGTFQSSSLDAHSSTSATPRMPSAGGFLNYDVSAQSSQGTGKVGSQIELGAFAGNAVGTTQVLNQDMGTDGHFIRLESTLAMDRPAQQKSLRLGDTISRGGAWGRPARIGGIQWSTNFSTKPDFITFPLPSVSGATTLPSTAEVFVNNVRAYEGDIQPGPFSLNELPVVTGQGEVRVVVYDLLGREQVIVQPYYASRSLLKPGLNDFSYEFGAVRENFGLASNDYGQWAFSGTHRHGFTDRLTGEVHGELVPDRQTLGFAATILFPQVGVVDAAIAGSNGDLGSGGLLALGFERQTSNFSFGLRTQVTSRQFDQSGLAPGTLAPARQTNAHIGWNGDGIGSFGLGYIQLDNRDQSSNELLSTNYSRNLGSDWFLGVSAFKDLEDSQESAAGLVLTRMLNNRTTASLNASRRNDHNSSLLQLQRNLPAGTGIGYRVLAGNQGSERYEGTLNLQNDYGTYALEAARFHEIDAYRGSISGGLAMLGGQAFLSRQLGDSFAVVRVPDYPGVRVYAENLPVARTNASGAALIPGLRPYEKNHLRIEQNDLPLDARIDALEVDAVPYYHSGYDIEFPVARAKGALLRIVTADGKPVPVGATVHLAGSKEVFVVALNGQTYVSGLERSNRMKVTMPDAPTCEFEVDYPETDDPLPDLGDFKCMEAKP